MKKDCKLRPTEVKRKIKNAVQRPSVKVIGKVVRITRTALCAGLPTPHTDDRRSQTAPGRPSVGATTGSGDPRQTVDLKSDEQETFRTPDSITIHLRDPIVKAAFLHMSEIWPASVPFAKLVEAGQRRLQRSTKENQEAKEAESQVLGQTLLSFYASASTNLVELSVSPPRFTLSVNAKPVACPLARYQAKRGNQVTNRRHESVFLAEAERRLLRCLDGEHDHAQLEKVMGVAESDVQRATVLEQLARHALLVG